MSRMVRKKPVFPIIASVVLSASILYNCLPISIAHAEDAAPSPLDTLQTISFSPDHSSFTNPERGWYKMYSTTSSFSDLSTLRGQGITMIMVEANLKNFRTEPISSAKLQEIDNAFALARKNGLNVIFRAAYDYDGVLQPEPTDLSVITGHIAQLKDIFYANEDVLYCVQAGFLGPWGEWHNSYFGNPPSLDARKSVLSALMDAVPKARMIEVRRPMFIRDMFDNQTITAANAFDQSDLSRTGFHDDALLSSSSENGTYVQSGWPRAEELNYCDNLCKYTPFVAESDMNSSYSDPDNAVYELNKLHAQALNSVYYPDVISKWKTTSYHNENTYDYITQHLGYRFELLDASVNTAVTPGGALHLRLHLQNSGFGNLINARRVQVVLSNGQQTYQAEVADDPRLWQRENGAMTKDFYFSVPSVISLGEWNLYLNLPSPYESLKDNTQYSVRFANTGTWNQDTGYNLVMSGVQISGGNESGPVDSFRQITREAAELLCGTVQADSPSVSSSSTGSAIPTAEPTVAMTESPTTAVPSPQVTASPAATAPSAGNSSMAVNNLKASPVSYNRIALSWDAAEGARYYVISRAVSSAGTYTTLATTANVNYTNTSVTTGTTYYYKVRAYSLNGTVKVYGTYSPIVSARTTLTTPASVRAAKATSSSIRVSWRAVDGATKYELWRSTSPTGTFSFITTTRSSYYTNSRLLPKKYYYYKVRAYRIISNKKVYSAFSGIVTATT